MKKNIIYSILSLFAGIILIKGGIDKFGKQIPSPREVVEKALKFIEPEHQPTLQKILYISGIKQTGYFWPLLGLCEVLFGLFLIFPRTRLLGAILLLPITFHIFLFHLFLEPEETMEQIMTAVLFLVNLLLIAVKYPVWKEIVWDSSQKFY